MYSLVRSQVSTRSRPLPRPSPILIWIFGFFISLDPSASSEAWRVAVGGLAGLADRHHHAAPIGVLPGDRGLHQRRIRYRHRDFAWGRFRRRAVDDDLDQLARAFAIPRHLLGEI